MGRGDDSGIPVRNLKPFFHGQCLMEKLGIHGNDRQRKQPADEGPLRSWAKCSLQLARADDVKFLKNLEG